MKVGDILLVERVLNCTGGSHPAKEYLPDPALMKTARSLSILSSSVRTGALLTAPRVMLNSDEKSKFLNEWLPEAAAVDMETAAAAQEAEQKHIPWMAVRVITDSLEDEMPLDFNAIASASGYIPIRNILRELIRKPGKLPDLLRLGRRSSLSAAKLTNFLESYLEKLDCATL